MVILIIGCVTEIKPKIIMIIITINIHKDYKNGNLFGLKRSQMIDKRQLNGIHQKIWVTEKC